MLSRNAHGSRAASSVEQRHPLRCAAHARHRRARRARERHRHRLACREPHRDSTRAACTRAALAARKRCLHLHAGCRLHRRGFLCLSRIGWWHAERHTHHSAAARQHLALSRRWHRSGRALARDHLRRQHMAFRSRRTRLRRHRGWPARGDEHPARSGQHARLSDLLFPRALYRSRRSYLPRKRPRTHPAR